MGPFDVGDCPINGGDEVYGDFTIVSQVLSELRSFEPGIGKVEDPAGASPLASYYHTNLIGTTLGSFRDSGIH